MPAIGAGGVPATGTTTRATHASVTSAVAATAPAHRPLGRSRRGRRSGPAKVRRIHHLAGDEIDDPGAQFGTDSSTGGVFFTRCRALPANTISTRFNLHRHLAKSLRSAGLRRYHPRPGEQIGVLLSGGNTIAVN